jgi:hypothetical protein
MPDVTCAWMLNNRQNGPLLLIYLPSSQFVVLAFISYRAMSDSLFTYLQTYFINFTRWQHSTLISHYFKSSLHGHVTWQPIQGMEHSTPWQQCWPLGMVRQRCLFAQPNDGPRQTAKNCPTYGHWYCDKVSCPALETTKTESLSLE